MQKSLITTVNDSTHGVIWNPVCPRSDLQEARHRSHKPGHTCHPTRPGQPLLQDSLAQGPFSPERHTKGRWLPWNSHGSPKFHPRSWLPPKLLTCPDLHVSWPVEAPTGSSSHPPSNPNSRVNKDRALLGPGGVA